MHSQVAPQPHSVHAIHRFYGALNMLCEEAGFLVEPLAHQVVAALPAEEGGGLVQAEAIVRALGVSDDTTFDALMAALSTDDGASGQRAGLPVLVHPSDAVRQLKAFVEAEGIAPMAPSPAGELPACEQHPATACETINSV